MREIWEKPDAEDDSIYTQPEQANGFAKRTNVDALAVAIGTAHGAYKESPDSISEGLRKYPVQ